MTDPRGLQREYYADTAVNYDAMHLGDDEHNLALQLLLGVIQHYSFKSVLDVGSGTGRVLRSLKKIEGFHAVGVEPSQELRQVGHGCGLGVDELVDGDGHALCFRDGEFDVVTAFGVLHHVSDPENVIAEMLRVSNRAIFISDGNNFGQGGLRYLKQAINAVGLWRAFNWIKTGGRGYSVSEGDGIAYSYSVFNNWYLLRRACCPVHIMTTTDTGWNPYRSASHVAILGLKRASF